MPELAGRQVRCKACGQGFQVPAESEDEYQLAPPPEPSDGGGAPAYDQECEAPAEPRRAK